MSEALRRPESAERPRDLPYWEHFPHGADIGVRGVGKTREQAFEQAALAMTAVITDPGSVAPVVDLRIDCSAPDDELLLAEWLNALIYEMATRNMLFSRFEVSLEDSRLSARVWGEPISKTKHAPTVEVKGATYTALEVRRANGEWIAQCVVDV